MTIDKSADFRSGFVSITGKPNAGKSTFLNRLSGEKIAITSHKPQTTRNRIQGICNYPDAQIVFIDTPGIHQAKNRLNRALVDAAKSAFSGVDLVLLLVSCNSKPDEETGFIESILKEISLPVILVITKIDLIDAAKLETLMEIYGRISGVESVFAVSSKNGSGIDELVSQLRMKLPEGSPYFPDDILTDMPERFIASEMIREKIFLLTNNEIPYSSAVEVERFSEKPDGLIEIDALIAVERDSQKGIVIGKGGAMLKKIGTAARQELEDFFQTKVMLRLFVNVKRDWTENDRCLKEFGYK